MHDEICSRLAALEAAEGVRVLYACESGSRAWGFASPDSDYDVRFIYARPVDWYISILPGRDVIELPVDGMLDINGWDIRKALMLLRKSNPALLEWLDSPIVYSENAQQIAPLRELLPLTYNPLASVHHYLSMASHQKTILVSAGGIVRRKKYFYLLRALFAARWSLRQTGPPPMQFEDVYAAAGVPAAVTSEIDLLLAQKRAGHELDGGERNPVIDEYVEELRMEVEAALPAPHSPPGWAMFDEALRKTLHLTWS